MKFKKKCLVYSLLVIVLLLSACNYESGVKKDQTHLAAVSGTANVTDLKIMFYTAELESEITVMVGEEIELRACAYDQTEIVENVLITWSSSDKDSIVITPLDNSSAKITVLKASEDVVKIKALCMDVQKELSVHTVYQAMD